MITTLYTDIQNIISVLKPDMSIILANLARNEAAVLDEDNPVCRIDTDYSVDMSLVSGTMIAKVKYTIDFADVDDWDEYELESAAIIELMTNVSNTVMYRLQYRNSKWRHEPLWRVNNATMSGVRTSLSYEYNVLPNCGVL